MNSIFNNFFTISQDVVKPTWCTPTHSFRAFQWHQECDKRWHGGLGDLNTTSKLPSFIDIFHMWNLLEMWFIELSSTPVYFFDEFYTSYSKTINTYSHPCNVGISFFRFIYKQFSILSQCWVHTFGPKFPITLFTQMVYTNLILHT